MNGIRQNKIAGLRYSWAISLAVLVAVAAVFLWHSDAGTALAQDGTPAAIPDTPVPPTPTPTPEPTATLVPTATPEPTNTPEPTWTPVPTWTPEPTNTPHPTNTPLPTNTPPPTFTPVPVNPQVAPGGTIFINCGPGEPCIDLHTSHTNISVDERALLSFSIVNSLGKPAMLTRLILELPSGWSMDGEGFADKCSGLCSANYNVATGEQRFIEVTAYPNHTGSFRLEGRIEWNYAGTSEILHLARDVQIKVNPGSGGNESRVEPLPTAAPPQAAPPQAAPPAPAATQPQAPPPAATQPQAPPPAPTQQERPTNGVGGGICNVNASQGPTAFDPSLLLVAGLLMPAGLAARLGYRLRRRRSRTQG